MLVQIGRLHVYIYYLVSEAQSVASLAADPGVASSFLAYTSADSRMVVDSYLYMHKRKYVHKVLVNCLINQLHPGKLWFK